MATIAAFAKARKMGKLTRVLFTPRESEDAAGTLSYDLNQVVADSTTIEEEDSTVNSVENEFNEDPILENVILGKCSVTLNSGDLPDELLTSTFGYIKDSAGNIYRPATYSTIWGSFEFAFDSSDDTIVVPKVKVIAKIAGSSLKTGMIQGTIGGTAYQDSFEITLDGDEGTKTIKSALYFKSGGKADLPEAV